MGPIQIKSALPSQRDFLTRARCADPESIADDQRWRVAAAQDRDTLNPPSRESPAGFPNGRPSIEIETKNGHRSPAVHGISRPAQMGLPGMQELNDPERSAAKIRRNGRRRHVGNHARWSAPPSLNPAGAVIANSKRKGRISRRPSPISGAVRRGMPRHLARAYEAESGGRKWRRTAKLAASSSTNWIFAPRTRATMANRNVRVVQPRPTGGGQCAHPGDRKGRVEPAGGLLSA